MNRDKIYDNNLLDYYGTLLTKRQNEVLELYLNDDLSMGEIALKLDISKTAVADLINRSLKILDKYENKLNLITLQAKREEIYSNILYSVKDKKTLELVNKLKDLK